LALAFRIGRNFSMKTAKDYLEEANAVVPKISIEEGIEVVARFRTSG